MKTIENTYFRKLSFADKVFYILCSKSCQLDMSGYDYILTTGTAARLLECSQYKVRKALKLIEEQGLAKRVCEGGCADDELRVWCIKGWCITKKARYTDVFKHANWEESKLVGEIWDIVPSQYYKTNTLKRYDRL